MPDSPHKVLLPESDLPTRWYNVLHDLPTPPPPVLHPGTGQPVGPDDLAPLFPMDLILQEVSQDQYIDIPGEVLDVYRLWRPSPLYRLECEVWQVRASYDQKPYRRTMMEVFGATVHPSPSDLTAAGRKILAE